MVSELFTVIRCQQHEGVLPLAESLEGVQDPAELGIDITDHPVVLGPHPSQRALVCRGRGLRQAKSRFVKPMAMSGGGDRHVDTIRIEGGGPAACGSVGRMRSQVTQVGEPRAVP